MRVTAAIDTKQIDKMELDITLRMSVEEWRSMMRALPSEWPSWKVAQCIATVLGHVTRSTETTLTSED